MKVFKLLHSYVISLIFLSDSAASFLFNLKSENRRRFVSRTFLVVNGAFLLNAEGFHGRTLPVRPDETARWEGR